MVQAWHADISVLERDRARLARALEWLTPDERARFDRYRGEDDRLMFALGRVMARRLVGRSLDVAPTAWRWREGPHGRPEIAEPDTSLRFNLAHSAGLVACVTALGRDVGVDVEDRARRALDPAIVNRFCSPDEARDVDAGREGWPDRFLIYWTLKEAYLKARGVGISVHLSDINFAVGPEVLKVQGPTVQGTSIRVSFLRSLAGADARWAFALTEPTARHLLAVAAATGDDPAPPITCQPFPADWLP